MFESKAVLILVENSSFRSQMLKHPSRWNISKVRILEETTEEEIMNKWAR